MKIQGSNVSAYITGSQGEAVSPSGRLKDDNSGKAKSVEVSISDTGKETYRNSLAGLGFESFEYKLPDIKERCDNDLALEHYHAMRQSSSDHFKEKDDYNLNDLTQSIMDAYEAAYNRIVQGHSDGTRQLYHDQNKTKPVTLEEDLAELDKAFEMRLANLEGYIYCRQSKDFRPSADVKAMLERRPSSSGYSPSDFDDQNYRDTAISMMHKAREEFLTLFNSNHYFQGAAKNIIASLFHNNGDFMAKTQKLFS